MSSWKLLNEKDEEVATIFAWTARKVSVNSEKLEFLNKNGAVIAIVDAAKIKVE